MAQGSRMVFSFQRHQLNEPPFSISMVRRPGEQKLIKLAIPNTQPYWSWLTVTRIFHKHVNEVMYIYIYISHKPYPREPTYLTNGKRKLIFPTVFATHMSIPKQAYTSHFAFHPHFISKINESMLKKNQSPLFPELLSPFSNQIIESLKNPERQLPLVGAPGHGTGRIDTVDG